MTRFKFGMLGIGALAGTLAFALPFTSAQAIGLGSAIQQAPEQISPLQEAQVKRRLNRRWNRQRHGQRYRERRGNNRYYRDGYYYRTPWWLAPAVIGGAVIGGALDLDDGYRGGNRHVAWCRDRYRSYDPRTNSWVSFSGNVNRCDSPYN